MPVETSVELPELKKRILDIVASEGAIDMELLKPDAKLAEIDFVSADMIMILMALEDEFDVYIPIDESLSEAETVDALIDSLVTHIQSTKGSG